MNNAISITNSWKIVLTDLLVLVAVYFIPALAHLSDYKLYYLDPMRFLLFAGYLVSRNHYNAYFLALTIPLVSTILSGHPPFYKAILISIELIVNVGAFHFLLKKVNWHAGILIFVTTLFAKLVYYTCKFSFIKIGLIEPGLITTGLLIQLYTVAGLSFLFALFYKKRST
ncbi:MAG: hypothetical protein IPP72_05300 [Chitinophagaceae bacterium]|nr:hypothetical protein [Chitinophagaceae bacterium]